MVSTWNTTEIGNTSQRTSNNPQPTKAVAVNKDRHHQRKKVNKMTKKAMIKRMKELGIITDESTEKSLNRRSKDHVERVYNEAVPKRLAYLASL